RPPGRAARSAGRHGARPRGSHTSRRHSPTQAAHAADVGGTPPGPRGPGGPEAPARLPNLTLGRVPGVVVARRADEIVDIAARLFYERGYQSVSTRSLAQAAGIQGGSLYHHFTSKEEILYRIVQYGSGEFFAGLLPHLQTEDAPYPERLERFVRAYITGALQRRHAIAVL